jgi:hypothetical protein
MTRCGKVRNLPKFANHAARAHLRISTTASLITLRL